MGPLVSDVNLERALKGQLNLRRGANFCTSLSGNQVWNCFVFQIRRGIGKRLAKVLGFEIRVIEK